VSKLQELFGAGKSNAPSPPLDLTQALKDAENALRDFIATSLQKKFGADWVKQCGVSADRVEKWNERKAAEAKRQESGTVEERILYYAEFYDLPKILKKHWDNFSPALGDWKTIEVFLEELGRLRDPDAHRRQLLPHQQHLAIGISGEIRTRLIRYRSKQETPEDYFPRIECVRDNIGNIYTPGPGAVTVRSEAILRVGDLVEFVVTASDPMGANLLYRLDYGAGMTTGWQDSNILAVRLTDKHVGKTVRLETLIKSPRQFHAHAEWDEFVQFVYTVLPPVT
jgi:hypothetical protein